MIMSTHDLVYTSEPALKRSIRKKYPNLTQKEWKATFNDLKKYIGIKDQRDVEFVLDEEWKQYKKDNDC